MKKYIHSLFKSINTKTEQKMFDFLLYINKTKLFELERFPPQSFQIFLIQFNEIFGP